MSQTFRLDEHGLTFASRGRGAELRERILACVPEDGDLILDFTGVTNVTYSFADEFAGKLLAERAGCVQFEGMTPDIASTVERAVQRRAGSLPCL